jgi:CheY-like chemotaxis protein
LIVEDESMERLILKVILEGAGHELYYAHNGEEALEIYVNQSIHVVITDLLMPHVGGIEFIEVLRRLFPNAAVIAISGKGKEALGEAKVAGAAAVLQKPLDPTELLEVVDSVLEENRRRKPPE